MCVCLLSVVMTMSEQEVPSAVAKRIILKFLPNENTKPAEILRRLTAQFDVQMISRTQLYDWN